MFMRRGISKAPEEGVASGGYPEVVVCTKDVPFLPDMQLSGALLVGQTRLGFSLEVRKSDQAKGQAGDGLWITGKAGLGALIAVYPGIVYPPDTYRYPFCLSNFSSICLGSINGSSVYAC